MLFFFYIPLKNKRKSVRMSNLKLSTITHWLCVLFKYHEIMTLDFGWFLFINKGTNFNCFLSKKFRTGQYIPIWEFIGFPLLGWLRLAVSVEVGLERCWCLQRDINWTLEIQYYYDDYYWTPLMCLLYVCCIGHICIARVCACKYAYSKAGGLALSKYPQIIFFLYQIPLHSQLGDQHIFFFLLRSKERIAF